VEKTQKKQEFPEIVDKVFDECYYVVEKARAHIIEQKVRNGLI